MTLSNKEIVTKNRLPEIVTASNKKIIVMMGAGDIGVEILKVTKILQSEG